MGKSDPKNWNDYEIVEQSDNNDYPPARSLFNESVAPPISEEAREASRTIDRGLSQIRNTEDFGFDDTTFGGPNTDDMPIEEYGDVEDRTENILKNLEKDLNYSSYFYERYGNVDVYFSLEDIYRSVGVFTSSDKRVNIKIIKNGTIFIGDYVSPNQIIEELIDGVVSFLVFKVNGTPALITGTLKEELVNGEEHVREAAFSLLPDGRVLLWNVMKQKWSSFYPNNLIEMTRDDTSAFE